MTVKNLRKLVMPILGVTVLALGLLAQNPSTNPNNQPQSTPNQSQPQSTPDQSQPQSTPDQQTPATTTPSTPQSTTPDTTSTDQNSSKLPKTGSELPLIAMLGSSAFGIATLPRSIRRKL